MIVASIEQMRAMTQISHLTPISLRLINGLRRIAATNLDLPLVPLNNNKQPLGDAWQHRPFSAAQLIEAIENGGVNVPIKGKTKQIQPQGFGLLTGHPLTLNNETYYLMAVDQDGRSAIDKIQELSGGQPLPKTVAFTSQRPGRCQYLFLVPEQYKDAIRTKKLKTGANGDDNKPEQLELRWTNLQSVLPPSMHPITGQYHWVEGCAIDEVEIEIAPNWLLEQMLSDPSPKTPPSSKPKFSSSVHHNSFDRQWTELDFALSYLDALSSYRGDDYDDWLTVGMALHSVDDSLLNEWDKWSQQSSKYKPGECEKKWKSFSPNGGVTLGTLAHMAKQDGWQFRSSEVRGKTFYSQNSNIPPNSPQQNSTVTGDTSRTGDTPNPVPLSLADTVTTVTAILQQGLKDYEERHQLDTIEARSLITRPAFWELVKALRTSLDEIHPEDHQRFNQLVDWHNATLNLNHILPPTLAKAFIHDGKILNIDPVSLWQYFLPVVLSLVGKGINLDVESHTIPAIAWTCLVGESGTGKSRAEKLILAPLKQRQHQEKKRYRSAIKEYKDRINQKKQDDPSPEPPKPERKYLFEVATIQAVMRRLSEQGLNGSVWARDELAGLFKSLNQFNARSGENEGLECLLKMWDGDGSLVDRVNAEDDSYAVEETRLNIAGGIQPGAFRQAFKDPNDPQGLQARFLYALPKIYPAKRVKGYCQLSDMLPDLYHWLDQLPTGTIKLSDEADQRYTHLVEQIGTQAESSPNLAIRAWMRKLPTQLLRIALALHLVEYYDYTINHQPLTITNSPERNFWELQLDTLERAVEVCRYYRSAFQVVQEKASDTDSISSILLKIWDLGITQPDGMTPREIYRNIKAIGRRAKELGRTVSAYTLELLSKLVEMGKGKLEKNGRFYRFKAIFNSPPDHPPNDDDNPNPTSGPKTPNNPNPPSDPNPPNNPTGNGEELKEHQGQETDINPVNTEPPQTNKTEATNLVSLTSDVADPSPQGEVKHTNKNAVKNQPMMTDNDPDNCQSTQPPMGNRAEGVTQVTEAQTHTGDAVSPSPSPEVSPVTIETDSQSSTINPTQLNPVKTEETQDTFINKKGIDSELETENDSEKNLHWLLQYLADLESSPAPHTRFTSNDQLRELFNEAQQKANSCWEQLQQICPDYSQRLSTAYGIVSQLIS